MRRYMLFILVLALGCEGDAHLIGSSAEHAHSFWGVECREDRLDTWRHDHDGGIDFHFHRCPPWFIEDDEDSDSDEG